ncbi:MAG: sulfotransferase [Pirellulales bacterium]|nr:sulfotransferase [Pirellulales bacterium]
MALENEDCFRKPPWNRAGIWTGANLRALWRILKNNRFCVHGSCWPECLVDLAFAGVNSGLGILQAMVYGASAGRVRLATDPLIILGHWRTGTTLLHELLALDPRHTCPTTFQCFLPNHFLLTDRFVKRWSSFVLPPSRLFDSLQMGWDRPQEDEFALCNMGIPSPYATIAFPNRPPQNQDYLELDSVPRRQRDCWKNGLRRFLQQVLYEHPGRLVLKSPTHTFRLPMLLELFPNACFIHMVRHPLAIFMSTMRLWKSLYVMHGYQKPDFEGLTEYVFATFQRMHARLETTRSLVMKDRFMDVRYEDLVGNPIDTIQRVYSYLKLGEFNTVRPAIEAYSTRHSNHRPYPHSPTSDLANEVFQRWKPYYEKYGYEPHQFHQQDSMRMRRT